MSLPYRLLPLLISSFIFFESLSQVPGDKRKMVEEIRKRFQQINSEEGLQQVKMEDAEEILGHATDGGATLTGYFKKDTLKKIIEWVGLSNRVIQTEYYLDNGRLLFVYSTEKQYAYNDSLQTLDYAKLVPSFQGRYYFNNENLIDALLSPKRRQPSVSEEAAGFLKRMKEHTLLLSRRRK